MTPVKYLPNGPVRGYSDSPILSSLIKRLEGYKFRVFVNGIEIFKSLLFPGALLEDMSKGKDYKVYPLNINRKLESGRTIKAKGYYYHQATRILPFALRGLLIRVRNVGIGSYENTFSKIFNESPVILHQLTGELYVDDGLDEALNIDRSSFFESDEAYQELYFEVLKRINPEQLPEDFRNRLSSGILDKLTEESIARNIRNRLNKLQELRREGKKLDYHETLVKRIGSLVSKYNYPMPKSDDIVIKEDSDKDLKAIIKSSENRTRINIILDKDYREPLRGMLVLILVAIKLAKINSQNSLEKFEKNLSELFKKIFKKTLE